MSLAALGLGANAKEDDVRAAYRRLRSERHPDKGGDADAFHRLQAEYDEAMVEVRQPKTCGLCAGSGSAYVGTGFSRVKMACVKCHGTGNRVK